MTDARSLTAVLKGRWHGRYGTAPCPCCQPDGRKGQNALTLADGRDGRLLAHCKKSACAFTQILTAAGIGAGDYRPPNPAELARREAAATNEVRCRAEQAQRLWQESLPIDGSPAKTYLCGRSITCDLPSTLRYHPACWHGATGTRLPALLALVEGSDAFAVHRTYLRCDGSGKADVAPSKAMLGPTAGGAVRLADGPSRLVVAEGIESGLSLLCGLLDGPATVWATLSTSGLRRLRLPPQPGALTIACDGDKPGREAAHALAERAHALGWQVVLRDPGDGADFNDILNGKGVVV